MRYSRGLKAISLSMAFVMLFTNTAPLKAYAAGLQEEVHDAMAGETMQVSPEVGTSVEPGSEPQVLALEPTHNPEEIEPQVGSGQDGAQQDNVEATQSPAPAATPAATETPAPATTPEPTVAPTETPEPTATPAPTEMPEATATPKPTAEPSPTETPAVTEIENEIATSESANSLTVPQDAVIEIGTYEELQLLGTGETVDGVTYAADGQYTIAQDIELPSSTAWTLPENFTGRIAPEEPSEDRTVYDAESDTIYVYHRFQLAVMAQENAAEEPVMDGDATAETFGMGQLIYPNGAEQPYLTYSPEHHYVISTQFCSDVPVSTYASKVDVPGPKDDGTRQYEGRDFPGQVVKTIDGVRYILIGNEEQLRAIGTDAKVYTAAYELKWVKDGLTGLVGHYEISTDDNGNPVMVYGGDADLLQEQNGTDTYRFQNIDDGVGAPAYGGVDQTTRTISTEKDSWKTEYTYSSDANYIIFRDIDLSGANWNPLMFSGTMVGAKANNPAERSTLWTNSSPSDFSSATGFAEGVQRPEIQNVKVVQNDAINPENTKGVGFFATLSRPSEIGENSIGTSGQVIVKNIALKNVHVENNTNELDVDVKLLGGTLAILGGIIGPLLNTVLEILTLGQVNFNTTKMLDDLLNVYATDKTVLATGAFAGRIEGNVQIEDCTVSTATVTSVNGLTGGFVGYTTGVTQYSILDKIAGTLVRVLEKIVGMIPGLGLDDLVEVLLENALPLNALIPTGYESPQLTNCMVTGLSGTIGSSSTSFNGGFAGQVIGARMGNCDVINSSYAVQAESYGGGFVGLARDAEIKGMLQDGLGILTGGTTGTLMLNCDVNGWAPGNANAVSGGSYLGGFAGALANSYTVDCNLSVTGTITGSGSHVGGWAGVGAIGWATDLGKNNTNDTTLLGGVTDLLGSLLNSGGDTTALLSLAGVSPSAIMGCQITSGGLTVHADGDYAGGFVGDGNGLLLTPATSEYLNKLTYWKSNTITTPPSGRSNTVTGLSAVTAGGKYAGGIAGSLGSASVGGLLNDTVGLGEFLGFTVDNVTLGGSYAVKATEYAGGAVGLAVGGTVKNVDITDLEKVSAQNIAGGFMGGGGPGSLADTDGLSLNLLGLNHLLEVGDLLNVIPGVKLTLENCTVSGADTGYIVEATGSGEPAAEYAAGGFIARSNSTNMSRCHAQNLKSVTADDAQGYAGGFVGISSTGELAELGDLKDSDGEVIAINDLLGTIGIMVPDYTNCTVSYADGGYVQADVAGGFAGSFESGKVNNQSRGEGEYYAVYNIDHVSGQTYAGGFAGKLYSGALADAGGGISILGGSGLKIDLGDLLQVVNAYVPVVTHAGVSASKAGLAVSATDIQGENGDLNAGSAGGFAGYASGAQVSTSDVNSLRHTRVTDPTGNADADAQALNTDGGSYYADAESAYAVTGGRYAGGYIGKIDIGSAASVGGGLDVLGETVSLSDLLSALNVVVTTVEHSDVYGAPGGYAVRAAAQDGNDLIGHAGGFAGTITGGHIQDSHAHNFSHIIGRESAGGYVGEMKPGDVAKLLPEGDVLNKLLNGNNILSGLQVFVPTIRNSSTDSVPCGGVVWAQAESTGAVTAGSGQTPGVQRGMAEIGRAHV